MKEENSDELRRDVQVWEGGPNQAWRKEEDPDCEPDNMPRLAAGEIRWEERSYGRPRGERLVGGANTVGGAGRTFGGDPGEFFEEPLGGPGLRGGQSEGNLSLPLKVALSALLPLWYGPRPVRSAEEAEDPTDRVLSGNWDMYPEGRPERALPLLGMRSRLGSEQGPVGGGCCGRVDADCDEWGGCADPADGSEGQGRDDGRRWGEDSTW